MSDVTYLTYENITSDYFSIGTITNEKDIPNNLIGNAILAEISEFRSEHRENHNEIIQKEQQIIYLQTELMKKTTELEASTAQISQIVSVRANTRRIYYGGLFTGVISILGGLVFNLIPVAIAGVGIVVTTLFGLQEMKNYG